MKHLYKKSELTFSLVLVGLYVALFSIADNHYLFYLLRFCMYGFIRTGCSKNMGCVRLTARQKTISILYRCS